MGWFCVSCLLAAEIGETEFASGEESCWLVDSETREEAESRAMQLCKDHAVSYQNVYGQRVVWSVVKVLNSYELEAEIGDGTEVFSRSLRAGELRSILADELG